MSKLMCGCGCSIISSLMKRLGRTTCCSDLLSCSHTSEQLQRLSNGCQPQPKHVKPFSSSDSLAKVQEVASWLLEMNQDLLSGGSSSRRSRGPGGPAVRGNASSTARASQQAAEEGDEDEHMNRVVEEEQLQQQRPEASQVDGERGQPWAPGESRASNGPQGADEREEGPPSEVNGEEKGARWMWGSEQRRLQGHPLGEQDEEEEEEEEENNNTESGREEEEEEEEGDAEEGLRSPSLRNNVSVPNNNLDSGCTHQSSFNKKTQLSGLSGSSSPQEA
ncbi:unnamed protein product [Lampetra planeri]